MDMCRVFGENMCILMPFRVGICGEPLSDCTWGCVKMQILMRTRRCVRMAKMQGAEAEGAGSVLNYMTKPECR